jgi:hypothetical protein
VCCQGEPWPVHTTDCVFTTEHAWRTPQLLPATACSCIQHMCVRCQAAHSSTAGATYASTCMHVLNVQHSGRGSCSFCAHSRTAVAGVASTCQGSEQSAQQLAGMLVCAALQEWYHQQQDCSSCCACRHTTSDQNRARRDSQGEQLSSVMRLHTGCPVLNSLLDLPAWSVWLQARLLIPTQGLTGWPASASC